MTAFNLFPSFVKIFYHSERGSHVMTRPTREWVGESWDSGGGDFPRWSDDTLISAPTMIKAFIDLLLPLYTDTVIFDSYIIFNVVMVGGLPVPYPVFSELLTGKEGDVTDPVEHLAWQKTYTMLTTDNHIAKLVLLDVPTGGQINKSGSVTGAEASIVAAVMAATNAWAGRDDQRAVAFRSINNSVNKALERKYGF